MAVLLHRRRRAPAVGRADWVDVERIFQRQAGKLDWGYVDSQLAPLAEIKGEPQILRRLHAVRSE